MKKICVVMGILVSSIIVGGFTACFEKGCADKHKEITISSVEELYAMKPNSYTEYYSYTLTCDIDLEGRVWEPIAVEKFYGNGHTIKNAVVNNTASYQGFFSSVDIIENVTFDNLTLLATATSGGTFGFAAGYGRHMKDITVKNSTANFVSTCEYSTNDEIGIAFGGIVGRLSKFRIYSDDEEFGEFENNRVENCTIECSSHRYAIIGGLMGEYREDETGDVKNKHIGYIANCQVEDVTIKATGDSEIACGGLIGRILYQGEKDDEAIEAGKLENCKAKNVNIKITKENGGEIYAGGAVGSLVTNVDGNAYDISHVSVTDCEITVKGTDYIYLGGIVGYTHGKITDVLSDNTKLSAETTSRGDNRLVVGGIAGFSQNTVQYAVSQRNTLNAIAAKPVKCAGVIGDVSKAFIINCAVNRNNSSIEKYVLLSDEEEKAINSYVIALILLDEGTTTLPIIYSTEWDSIVSKLQLNSTYWSANTEGFLELQ